MRSAPQALADNVVPETATNACSNCASSERLSFQFSYAFQPIVDVSTREIFAHEALVRGVGGEPAISVISQVTEANRYRFDQSCRVKAIKTASRIGMNTRLSINFLPNAIYRPEVCIRTTLESARAHGLPIDRIMFETIEGDRVADAKWFAEVLREYKRMGFITAIDDFGAGYAGLNLLADFQPDVIKLDMDLVRHINVRRPAQEIVRMVVALCRSLDIRVIAEGIETVDEYHCLEAMGITLMQGYLFCRPIFEGAASVETVNWPGRTRDLHSPDDLFAGVTVPSAHRA